jgi:hypothetical protein
MTAIAFTANNRPGYLQDALISWKNVRGIERYPLVFHVEPVNSIVREMCEGAQFGKSNETIVNPEVYGALGNPWHAFETGFEYDDFVVLAEDDSVVSTDVMEYFEWCRHQYQEDDEVLAVCAFWGQEPVGPVDGVHRRHWFAPTIWGTWADRWDELRKSWDFDYSHKGWDWNLNERIMGDRHCVFPAWSRSQHIGKHNGTHMLPGDFEELQSRSFIERVEAPLVYKEIL